MVTMEQRGEETPKACVVTRRSVHMRGDASTSYSNQQPWICKRVEPPHKFDPDKEKKPYREARKEINTTEWAKKFP